jgi:hypothetical protein
MKLTPLAGGYRTSKDFSVACRRIDITLMMATRSTNVDTTV